VAIQATQKVVVTCYINFEDDELIKRWQIGQEMNVMNGKFTNENKWSNHKKLFSFATKSCVYFWSLEFIEEWVL
jgi:hypothetical protein